MADFSYDLSDLFARAFGHTTSLYATPSAANASPSLSGVRVKQALQAKKMSWLGTPILSAVKFKRGTYQAYRANGELHSVERGDFSLPAAALIDFKRSKNLTQTPVLGDTGTVKEVFGFDNWHISIKGFCLDEPQQKAYEQLAALLEWEALAGGIEVSGELFTDKRIYKLVIQGISIPQIQGSPGVIPFTLEAVSDQALELLL